MERIKINKRNRQRPTYRWTDDKTAELLKMILIKINSDISQFEKPTRKVFYQSIIRRVSSLRTLDWNLIVQKMRNLKVSYFAAESMRDAAADIEQWNEQDIADQIKRKCPFYTLLRKIYGQQGDCITGKDETSHAATENNEKMADDNADKNEIEEGAEKDRVDLFKNCSETLLSYLKDDFAEVDDVKEEQELEPLSFEKIVITDAHNILPNRASKHLWRDDETKALLETVLNVVMYDAEAFQKPKPQSFYEAILKRRSEIRQIEWTVARSKMENLRASYVAADLLLKQKSGEDIFDDNALNEEIRRVCPFFDLLHKIFKKKTSLESSSAVAQIKSDIKDNDEYIQSSEESEGAYPFEDEAEVFKPIKTPKMRRLRLKPNHSWTDKATRKLLTSILSEVNQDPQAFEKPTARSFYTRISPELCWKLCRNKLRNLRNSYKVAHTFRDENSYTYPSDEDWLKANIKKICPFWDLMHQIFSPRSSNQIDDRFVVGLEIDEDEGDQDEDEVIEAKSPSSSPSTLNSRASTTIEAMVKKKERVQENDPIEEKEKKEEFADDAPQLLMQSTLEVKRIRAFKLEKLKLEREKVINDLEIRKLELQHQFDIKKLEVERDERLALAKLKIEMEERLKKYELELKYKNNIGYINL